MAAVDAYDVKAIDRIGAFSPSLKAVIDHATEREMWDRPHLSQRDRSLIAFSSVVALFHRERIIPELERAIHNGLNDLEIGMILAQLGFYAGYPSVLSAGMLIADHYDSHPDLRNRARANPPSTVQGSLRWVMPEKTRTKDRVGHVAPMFIAVGNEVLYGKVWEDPILTKRDRSLVVVATLTTTQRPMPLPHHVERAIGNGVTVAELGEMLGQVSFYAGVSASMSAALIISDLLESRPEFAELPLN